MAEEQARFKKRKKNNMIFFIRMIEERALEIQKDLKIMLHRLSEGLRYCKAWRSASSTQQARHQEKRSEIDEKSLQRGNSSRVSGE